jgi:hypothetical protein
VISVAHSILSELAAASVTIEAAPAGRLRVRGPSDAVARLTPRIRAAKFALLAELEDRAHAQSDDRAAIEERAALAADRVPVCYLHAWARLQCQQPPRAPLGAWREAIEDGGLFLDAWGEDSATMRWTAGELFEPPYEGEAGRLVWQLKCERVESLREDRARLRDGRTIKRGI